MWFLKTLQGFFFQVSQDLCSQVSSLMCLGSCSSMGFSSSNLKSLNHGTAVSWLILTETFQGGSTWGTEAAELSADIGQGIQASPILSGRERPSRGSALKQQRSSETQGLAKARRTKYLLCVLGSNPREKEVNSTVSFCTFLLLGWELHFVEPYFLLLFQCHPISAGSSVLPLAFSLLLPHPPAGTRCWYKSKLNWWI